MSYSCSICGVSFGTRGSTIAHVCGSTSGDHLGVGYQQAGEFVEPVDGGDDERTNSTQETRDGDAPDSGADPDRAPVEATTDGGRSDPVIPAAPGRTQDGAGDFERSTSDSTAPDAAPCCENCGDERLHELSAGIEFSDARGVSHVTDAGDVQCSGCGWVGEPR